MDLFSKAPPPEAALKTAAGKLANGAALVVGELSREPARGLVAVVGHVQRSVPGLLETQRGLEAAQAQLDAVLAELGDAAHGLASVAAPSTQDDVAALQASLARSLAHLQALGGSGGGGDAAAGAGAEQRPQGGAGEGSRAGSSMLKQLFTSSSQAAGSRSRPARG